MKVFAAAAALTVAILAGAAQAAPTPTHSYEFSGSLADGLGGPSMALNPGATASFSGTGASQGLEFAFNQGPNLSNAFAAPDVYSIEMYFSLENLGSYRRLVDFKNGSTDHGLYFYNDSIVFYDVVQNLTRDVNALADTMIHLVVTRAADNNFKAYFNGDLALNLNDSAGRAKLTAPNQIVRFFDDDGSEASAGFVDFIRTYDSTLTQADVTGLYNNRFGGAVPEPATWALMILGFGSAGAMLRRRRFAAA